MPQFALLIYLDPTLVDALPPGRMDTLLHGCIANADALRRRGTLHDSQMLAPAPTAKAVRRRGGRLAALDGPFSEAKEVLGGFNLIEAADIDEAVAIAATFPWSEYGCVEVRPVLDFEAVRARVGAVDTAVTVGRGLYGGSETA